MSELHTIRVTKFALSEEEGRAVSEEAWPTIAAGRPVVLDFSDCRVLCSHWLSGFYSLLLDTGPVAEVRAAVQTVGVRRTNQHAIDLMFQVAQEYEDRDGEEMS